MIHFNIVGVIMFFDLACLEVLLMVWIYTTSV